MIDQKAGSVGKFNKAIDLAAALRKDWIVQILIILIIVSLDSVVISLAFFTKFQVHFNCHFRSNTKFPYNQKLNTEHYYPSVSRRTLI